jgi:hypothetical protein
MSGVAGALAGALALVALETIVQPNASKRVGGLMDTVSRAATNFLDPNVPGIGQTNRRSAAAPTGQPAAAGTSPAPAYNPNAIPPPTVTQ